MPPSDDQDDSCLLRAAAEEGDVQKLKLCLKQGVNVNATNEHKDTALLIASFHGKKDIVRTLIEAKANLNAANKNGQTPLQLAASRGHLEVVKELTKAKCNLDLNTNYSEFTALHFASKNGHPDVCRHLLDSKANEEILDLIDKPAEYYAPNKLTAVEFQKGKPKGPSSIPSGTKSQNKENDKVKPKIPATTPDTKPKIPATVTNTKPKIVLTTESNSPAAKPSKKDDEIFKEKFKPEFPVEPQIKDANSSNAEPPMKDTNSNSAAAKIKPQNDSPTMKRKKLEGKEIPKYDPREENDEQRKKWDYLKRNTDVGKAKSYKFEWSEEYKQRMKLSVIDRLTAGKKKDQN